MFLVPQAFGTAPTHVYEPVLFTSHILLERSYIGVNGLNNPIEIRKVVISVILTMLWICLFLFFPGSLVIQWSDTSTTNLTALKPIIELFGFLVIFFYNLLNRAHPETQKLSWTAFLTIVWLALILFYPFKDPANTSGGAVGFFTLIGGLAVCVLWVRFFSDEIIA